MTTQKKPPQSNKSAPTNDELLAQFDDLGVEDVPPSTTSKASKPSIAKQPLPASSTTSQPQDQPTPEQDPLAELNNLVAQRPISRPTTPGIARTGDSGGTGQRKSGESTTTTATTTGEKVFTPATTGEESPEPAEIQAGGSGGGSDGGGGWWGGSGGWGGLLATATKAVGQAQAAVKKELEKNEEAQRWTEQIKGRIGGNVGALKGLGK